MEPQKICSDLVGIKSENPLGDTSEVIEYIRDFLDARGIESLVTRNEGGRAISSQQENHARSCSVDMWTLCLLWTRAGYIPRSPEPFRTGMSGAGGRAT